jgi:hypothetical protein
MTDDERPLNGFRVRRVATSDEPLFVLWVEDEGRVWVLPSATRSRIEAQLLAERIDEVGSFWDLRMAGAIAELVAARLVTLVDLDDETQRRIVRDLESSADLDHEP